VNTFDSSSEVSVYSIRYDYGKELDNAGFSSKINKISQKLFLQKTKTKFSRTIHPIKKKNLLVIKPNN
jgi:hypothetical protein